MAFSAACSCLASFSFIDFNLLAWPSSFLSLACCAFNCLLTFFWYFLRTLSAFLRDLSAFLIAFFDSLMPLSAVETCLAVDSAVFDALATTFCFSVSFSFRAAASEDNSLTAEAGIFCFLAEDNLSATEEYAFLADASFLVALSKALWAFLLAVLASELNCSYDDKVVLARSTLVLAFLYSFSSFESFFCTTFSTLAAWAGSTKDGIAVVVKPTVEKARTDAATIEAAAFPSNLGRKLLFSSAKRAVDWGLLWIFDGAKASAVAKANTSPVAIENFILESYLCYRWIIRMTE
mmetsp:Transcript_22328/g.55321  ORF Transcript_22328/g.55321 Transcript_22328/m.55321 type:complete len:292 (+) Transcript_22328:2572-3447(+)